MAIEPIIVKLVRSSEMDLFVDRIGYLEDKTKFEKKFLRRKIDERERKKPEIVERILLEYVGWLHYTLKIEEVEKGLKAEIKEVTVYKKDESSLPFYILEMAPTVPILKDGVELEEIELKDHFHYLAVAPVNRRRKFVSKIEDVDHVRIIAYMNQKETDNRDGMLAIWFLFKDRHKKPSFIEKDLAEIGIVEKEDKIWITPCKQQ